MNHDEIIAMAREARISEMGMNIDGSSYLLGLFERFAALVAAKEREACAKVCEEMTGSMSMFATRKEAVERAAIVRACARAIRARGQA